MRAAAIGAPVGAGMAGFAGGPCPTGCVTRGLAAGRRDPQDTQKRFATGLRVEQVVQTGPSSSRASKLKAGASGRERPPSAASALYSGRGTTPRPTGGVGGTSPAGDAKRRPQSWQNARFSGLLRPQRSQITSPKGNPQDTGTSSTFQCPHLGRPGRPRRFPCKPRRAARLGTRSPMRNPVTEALAPRQKAAGSHVLHKAYAPIVVGTLGNPLTSPRSFA